VGWTVTPLLGIVLPIVVALVWGAWIAPRARRRLPDPGRLALELVIFAVATALPYRKVSDTFKVSDTSSQF
jgi:hypothetical protein